MKSRFVAAGFLLLSAFAYGQSPQIMPFSADLQISTTRPEASVQEITGKVYAGNGHVRLNMESGGHATVLITDFATKTTDVLLIDQKMYIEYKVDALRGPKPDVSGLSDNLRPYNPQNPCANEPDVTCKKFGVEQVSGRTCDHWEVTDKKGRVTDLWIDQQLHLPIKIVTKDVTTLLSNIKEGEPDASLFTIPAGYHKLNLGSCANDARCINFGIDPDVCDTIGIDNNNRNQGARIEERLHRVPHLNEALLQARGRRLRTSGFGLFRVTS